MILQPWSTRKLKTKIPKIIYCKKCGMGMKTWRMRIHKRECNV